MPILVDPVPIFKERTIKIIKEEIYKDVNVFSYKYAEAIAPEMKRPGDAFNAASDTSDSLDLRIIQRGLEYRDAQLRDILSFALAGESVDEVNNAIDIEPEYLEYNLKLDSSIDDKILKPLAITIHRYLCSGILYDWYGKSMGMKQAQVYESELSEMESAIVGKLRTSRAKRPYQPLM